MSVLLFDGVNGNGRGCYIFLVFLGIEMGLLNFIKKSLLEEVDLLVNYELDNCRFVRCLVYFFLNLVFIRVYLEFFEGDSELEENIKMVVGNYL